MSEMELKDRYALALSHIAKNAKQIAQEASISASALSQINTGKTKVLKYATAQKLAKALNVDTDWLAFGQGTMERTNIIAIDDLDNEGPPDGFVQIPEYAINIGAGAESLPTFSEIESSYPATYRLSFFTSKGIKPGDCKRFRVKGTSMAPTIMDQDYITIDCSETNIQEIVDDKIYVIVVNDRLMVRRLVRTLKGVLMHPDSPSHKDEEVVFSNDVHFRLIGRVIDRSGSVY